MIQVSELTKSYGERKAIDQLNFEARKGEILGFLGPNGAGKTTTMRILSGYMPPSSGTAIVAGYDVISESLEARKRIGYLPETVPLYTDMTVYDYLKFMADLRHLTGARDIVMESLEMVGLADRAGGFIGNLSKGMRQRVGLAQALLHRPEVLILDEPTIGLDPSQIIDVRNIIREMGKERTVLLSTHILPEAQQLCDRIMIINKGKIVVEDSAEKLQTRLNGAEKVLIKVAGSAETIIEKINRLKGVEAVTVTSPNSIEVQFTGTDLRPELARTAIKAGADLLEMKTITMSLEDIFLQLTQEEHGTKG